MVVLKYMAVIHCLIDAHSKRARDKLASEQVERLLKNLKRRKKGEEKNKTIWQGLHLKCVEPSVDRRLDGKLIYATSFPICLSRPSGATQKCFYCLHIGYSVALLGLSESHTRIDINTL